MAIAVRDNKCVKDVSRLSPCPSNNSWRCHRAKFRHPLCQQSSRSSPPRAWLQSPRVIESEPSQPEVRRDQDVSSMQVPEQVDILITSRKGVWRIRPYAAPDMDAILQLQTNAFHEAHPIQFINQFTYQSFRAEVLDALKQKIKGSKPDAFQMLVAEDVSAMLSESELRSLALQPAGQLPAGPADSSTDSQQQASLACEHIPVPDSIAFSHGPVVGVVEVTLMDSGEVLRCLSRGAECYAYVSSMAVDSKMRRRGLACALLQASEQQSTIWGQKDLALHVYQTNTPAVQLYQRYGMQVIDTDPAWKAVVGGRVRLLMHKVVG